MVGLFGDFEKKNLNDATTAGDAPLGGMTSSNSRKLCWTFAALWGGCGEAGPIDWTTAGPAEPALPSDEPELPAPIPGAEDETELHSQPFRPVPVGHNHEEITETGLPMLPHALAQDLGEANEDSDYDGSMRPVSRYHMDNCRFVETFALMRESYDALVTALSPSAYDRATAIAKFGIILHQVQDFYAHSNWVEARQTDLFDRGNLLPPTGRTGTLLGPMFVLREDLPPSFAINRASTGIEARLPIVVGPTFSRVGLITGTYDNVDRSVCPAAASVAHGDWYAPLPATHLYLAKDDPGAVLHEEAVALARRQTTEEFCRLDRLVRLRHGDRASAFLYDTWQVNRSLQASSCGNSRAIVAAAWNTAL